MADNPLTTDASDVPTQPQIAVRDTVRTVVFAQIVGTQPLYESLGDIRALSVITRAQPAASRRLTWAGKLSAWSSLLTRA